MELCSGGELFDRITAKGSYSEREAARIFRQIVNVVHVCHFMGVMHRDLKPENFLLVNKDEDSPIKAIDFGLSVFIEQGSLAYFFSFSHMALLLFLFIFWLSFFFDLVFMFRCCFSCALSLFFLAFYLNKQGEL